MYVENQTLEARWIVVQIATASKDFKMAHGLRDFWGFMIQIATLEACWIRDFWGNPNLNVSLSFTHFAERLIYSYKDRGSDSYRKNPVEIKNILDSKELRRNFLGISYLEI